MAQYLVRISLFQCKNHCCFVISAQVKQLRCDGLNGLCAKSIPLGTAVVANMKDLGKYNYTHETVFHTFPNGSVN